VVGSRQLHHRLDRVFYVGVTLGAVVRGHIVGAGHDVHDARLQIDDVGAKANQHLLCSLTADAAAEIVGTGGYEGFMSPALGNRVTQKHDARGVSVQALVLPVITSKKRPVTIWPLTGPLRGTRRRRTLRHAGPADQQTKNDQA
jgi:hypothetical protein